MRTTKANLRSTAVAALLSLPIAAGGALAQQSQGTNQTDQSATSSQDTAQQSTQSTQSTQSIGSGQADSGQADSGEPEDALVATVGDAEIRGSDVMMVIGMLPPQLQSQPPEMLVPLALEQLILRELILQEARGQNLASDPEVVALTESSAQTAEEDAMVQVWLDREMSGVVTDEAVQQVYDQTKAQGDQDLPPLEAVRPQIEQHLRQQAMQEIRTRLREGADVVLYDPTGRPMEQQTGNARQDQGQDPTGTASTSQTGGVTSGTSGGGQTGDTATAGAASGASEAASDDAGTPTDKTQSN